MTNRSPDANGGVTSESSGHASPVTGPPLVHPGDPTTAEAAVRDVMRTHYGRSVRGLELLTGGLDRSAWSYRVDLEDGEPLCVRITRGRFRSAVTRVPRHLRDAGIEAVVAPIRTVTNELVVRELGCSWAAYPFVEGGVDGWGGRMTAAHWADLGATMRAVHDTTIPPSLRPLTRREEYAVSRYAALVEIDSQLHRLTGGSGAELFAFAATWQQYRQTILGMLDQMCLLAEGLRDQPAREVVCHGDLHPGNVLVSDDGAHVVDWDDVLLAPCERDLIFVWEVPGAAPTPFLSAYGLEPAEIDWPALTYFRCERVVQDAIEFAKDAVGGASADDVAASDEWLREAFQTRGEAAVAIATAHCLPAELDLLRQG